MVRKAIRVLKPGNYGEGHNAAWSALVYCSHDFHTDCFCDIFRIS